MPNRCRELCTCDFVVVRVHLALPGHCDCPAVSVVDVAEAARRTAWDFQSDTGGYTRGPFGMFLKPVANCSLRPMVITTSSSSPSLDRNDISCIHTRVSNLSPTSCLKPWHAGWNVRQVWETRHNWIHQVDSDRSSDIISVRKTLLEQVSRWSTIPVTLAGTAHPCWMESKLQKS